MIEIVTMCIAQKLSIVMKMGYEGLSVIKKEIQECNQIDIESSLRATNLINMAVSVKTF